MRRAAVLGQHMKRASRIGVHPPTKDSFDRAATPTGETLRVAVSTPAGSLISLRGGYSTRASSAAHEALVPAQHTHLPCETAQRLFARAAHRFNSSTLSGGPMKKLLTFFA